MTGDFNDRVILGLLLEHQPAHLSTDELARELGGAAAAVRVADSPPALHRAGLVGALLSGLQTFLQPDKRAAQHHAVGVEYIEMRNRARMFRTIEQTGMSEDERRRYVKDLSQRRSELNRGAPSISDEAFKAARRSIEAGESTHVVDRATRGAG